MITEEVFETLKCKYDMHTLLLWMKDMPFHITGDMYWGAFSTPSIR